jgi:hypothetical protein
MIVRVLGIGQFEISSSYLDKMNQLDNEIVELVSRNDSEKMMSKLRLLRELVTENGKLIESTNIVPSDFIIPPLDLTVNEARRLFRGEGLIPE